MKRREAARNPRIEEQEEDKLRQGRQAFILFICNILYAVLRPFRACFSSSPLPDRVGARLTPRTSHRTVRALFAYGSSERQVITPAPSRLTTSRMPDNSGTPIRPDRTSDWRIASRSARLNPSRGIRIPGLLQMSFSTLCRRKREGPPNPAFGPA